MQINQNNSLNFGRAFTTSERKEADNIRKEALKVLDCDKIITIIPETSFPSEQGKNIGVGQLNSKYNGKFLDFIQTYTGANSIKVLPQGEYKTHSNNFYCNYSSSSLTLGTHMINLEELTGDEMGNILSKDTLNSVYKSAKDTGVDNVANFENVVGKESSHNKALKEAYENFTNSQSSKLKTLKKQFTRYKTENSEIIEKRALFEALTDDYKTRDIQQWSDTDRNLFNNDIISEAKRNGRVAEIKEQHEKDIDFTYFKQYLADKNLAKAKKQMNAKGLTLTGDCQIGFSPDEIWGYPKAFEKANIASDGWGLRALDYSNILQEGSESNKLIKLKAKQFAKRYDNIRFDVGWSYASPILYVHKGDEEIMKQKYKYNAQRNSYTTKEPLKDKLLNIIEDTVKSVKGENYKQRNLFYETEAGPDEFSPFDWGKNKVRDEFKNRTIIQSTMYMDDSYATIDCLEKRMGVNRDNYIIMAGNHDHLALNSLANKKLENDILSNSPNGQNVVNIVEKQYSPLSKGLKLDEQVLRKSPKEFIKAKFAYNFLGKNVKMFFMDVFGRDEQFDSQWKNTSINYRQRISPDYEKEFHKSVQDGRGLNIMDALAKAMKGKGLDKSHQTIYDKLVKYGEILSEQGALTEEEANRIFTPPVIHKNKNKPIAKILVGASLITALGSATYFAVKNKLNYKKKLPSKQNQQNRIIQTFKNNN